MAKVYQLQLADSYTQAQFDGISHSFLFAQDITPVASVDTATFGINSIIVTSNVESDGTALSTKYRVLADDSKSETSIDISTGKFVAGNLICGIALLDEIQRDVQNYVAFEIAGSDYKFFKGVCSTTQSQDYTPNLVANSRVIKMLTPEQLKTLGFSW